MSVKGVPPPAKAKPATSDISLLRSEWSSVVEPAQRAQLLERLSRSLVEHAQSPRADDAPELWLATLAQVADKSLALSWLAEIRDEVCLSELAMRARGAEIRYAAVQGIRSTSMLEQVAQAARNKDKRVYQHCSEQLRQRRHAEVSARRATEIAEQVQQLLAHPPLPNTVLLGLKTELDGLLDAGEAGMRSQALMQQALEQLHRESELLRDLQAARKAAEQLQREMLQPVWPWGESLNGWRHQHAGWQRFHAELPDGWAEHPAAQALQQAFTEMVIHLAQLEADDERFRACDRFLAELERDATVTADRHACWAALPGPENALARDALDQRWRALMLSPTPAVRSDPEPEAVSVPAPPTPEPAPLQPAQARLDQDAVRVLLDQLEQAIGEGHLVAADALAKQLKTRIAGHTLRGALESRWHVVLAQLETLRGWARWGTQQAREKLIQSAQALSIGEHDIETLASDINALRDEWKRLNAHAAASKAEWESFDAALEQAYQPVALYRAEQAALQAQARATREGMCAAWEAELAQTDWSQADFKALEARRADWITQWRAAAKTGFRDERELRKRFDGLIASIDQHLNDARAVEYQRRELLVSAALALAEQADLRVAIAEAKALQQRWGRQAGSVRLKRGDDHKQWTRFRTACNAVFQRLEAQRAEQAADRQAQIQFRQGLLDAFEATLAGAELNQIKPALAQFRNQWESARSSGRDSDDGQENRARQLLQQAQQRLDTARLAKHRASVDWMAEKAALVERVESAALQGRPLEAVLAEVRQAWDGLPQLPGKAESLMSNRLVAASSINADLLAVGGQTRADILLDLEIALGLPSPESLAETRRERQLGRLQNHFRGAPETETELQEALARWYATGAQPDAMLDQRMAAVVAKLVEKIGSS